MERQGARRRGEWLWRRARQLEETDIIETDSGVENEGVEMDGVEIDGEGANVL